MIRPAAILAAALLSAGCIAALPNQGAQTPYAAQRATELAPTDLDPSAEPLLFGINWVGHSIAAKVANEFTRHGLKSIPLESDRDPKESDVILRLTWQNSPIGINIEALSAYTRQLLFKGSDGYWTVSSFNRQATDMLKAAFAPGTTLHAIVARDRRAKAGVAAAGIPAAGKPAETSLTGSDIAAIVKATMAGEAAKKDAEHVALPPSDADVPNYSRPQNPDDYAVVVGIEQYSDLPKAAYAERDARAVKNHLLALGYPERNVSLLLGSRAGKAGLTKNLETWLANNVNERSTVFVYYSGHGAPDPKTGQAYLVPWDGDPQFLEDTGYPVKRLYAKLGALKARKAVVVLDACFSGAGGRSVLAKGLRPLVAKVDLSQSEAKVVSLAAADGAQVSGSLDAQGHGLFTYYFLRGLNGAAKDAAGRVTLRGLHEYLTPNVQDAARRDNRDQTPQLWPSAGALANQPLR